MAGSKAEVQTQVGRPAHCQERHPVSGEGQALGPHLTDTQDHQVPRSLPSLSGCHRTMLGSKNIPAQQPHGKFQGL